MASVVEHLRTSPSQKEAFLMWGGRDLQLAPKYGPGLTLGYSNLMGLIPVPTAGVDVGGPNFGITAGVGATPGAIAAGLDGNDEDIPVPIYAGFRAGLRQPGLTYRRSFPRGAIDVVIDKIRGKTYDDVVDDEEAKIIKKEEQLDAKRKAKDEKRVAKGKKPKGDPKPPKRPPPVAGGKTAGVSVLGLLSRTWPSIVGPAAGMVGGVAAGQAAGLDDLQSLGVGAGGAVLGGVAGHYGTKALMRGGARKQLAEIRAKGENLSDQDRRNLEVLEDFERGGEI